MSYTQTPNYGFIKPNVNADDDLWGDHLNQNADQLDSIIHGIDTRPAGGVQSFNTRVGAITLQGTDVTTALGYTPYDVANPAGYQTAGQVSAALGAYLPLTGGTLTGVLGVPNGTPTVPGVAIGTADGTGISRSGAAMVFSAQGTASLALFASGGQFYGPLNMLNAKVQTLGDATAAQDAVNLRTADARYAPLASPAFTGNPTAPTPAPGDNDTSLATTAFVAAAVSAGSVAGVASFNTRTGAVVLSTTDVQSALGFAPAPLNAPIFTGDARAVTPASGDADTSIATTAFVAAAVAPAGNNAGRNLIHNPTFTVAQRGAGPFTASNTYTLDRWQFIYALDTVSISQVALADSDRAGIGDEAAAFALQNVFAGNAGAGSYTILWHKIENVRRLSNRTVCISLWARAASGTPKIGISIAQNFGTGGSPSAQVRTTAGAVTIAATWARYSISVALPSVSGMTLGTNGDNFTMLELWYSSGTTNNAAAGNIGVQSGTIQLWGVQLEVGTQATPLDYGGSPQQQLAQCQRFYQTGQMIFSSQGQGGFDAYFGSMLPVPMRASPTLTGAAQAGTGNCTNFRFGSYGLSTGFLSTYLYVAVNVTATASYTAIASFTASADL